MTEKIRTVFVKQVFSLTKVKYSQIIMKYYAIDEIYYQCKGPSGTRENRTADHEGKKVINCHYIMS